MSRPATGLSHGSDPVRILSWNIEHGRAVKEARRWISRLSAEPDVVCVQELRPGDEELLQEPWGTGYVAEPRPGSSHANAIFVREDGDAAFVVTDAFDHPAVLGHAPANVAVRLRGPDGSLSDRALSLFCIHASFNSPATRLIEAEFLNRFAQPGWLTVVMGDFNDAPAGTVVDWDEVTDRAFYAHRTYPLAGGERPTDDRADRTLRAAGYIDPAAWAAEHLRLEKDPLAPTAGYRRPDQGGLRRVDRAYVTGPLAPAICGYWVGDRIEDPELEDISDHLPVMLELDRTELSRLMSNRQASTAA
ncbi:endonuclease/exonuclease/phosphatase family protein [Streptomyces sp. HK10]|uniref:endonuclease/exonuclease/phosphatase family protein n=1 Tax=Streptomyces sp. HK10 TaxID=3373255 RepID=UPI003747A246